MLRAFALSFALLIAGLLCLMQQPHAQLTMTGVGPAGDGAAVAYQGPGDIKSYVAWWGLSAYSSAARGSNAVNVCDVATGAVCANWVTDATTGALVPTTIGGSACNVIACEAATLYDQTAGGACGGSCDLTNTHTGGFTFSIGRPPIVASGPNSTYCLSLVNSDGRALRPVGNLTQAAPWSAALVANRTGDTGGLDGAILQSAGGIRIGYQNAVNKSSLYTGSSIIAGPTANDNAFNAIGYVQNNASSLIGVNSTSASTVSTGNTTGWTLLPQVGSANAGGSIAGLTGIFCEGGIANATWNATDIINVNANAHARYGVW